MDYSWAWWSNPYLWAILTAFCIGFFIASLTRFSWLARKRISAALFALSVAIAVAATGSFVVDNDTLSDIGLAYTVGIAAVCFGAIFRFPRIVGIPILALVAAGAVFFVVSLESWNRYLPDSPVGSVSILARDDESLRFELELFSSRTVGKEEGNSISLILEYLDASRFWFFGGRYARLIGFATEDSEHLEQSPLIAKIPGWTYSVAVAEPFSPRDLYRYQLRIGESRVIEWILHIPGGPE